MDKYELGEQIIESVERCRELRQLPTEGIIDLLLHDVWADLEVFQLHSDLISVAMELLKRQNELIKALMEACETLVRQVDHWMDFGERPCQLCGHHHIHDNLCPYLEAKAALAKAQP